MDIRLNLADNQLLVGSTAFSLDDLRTFILTKWHPLARRYAIRPLLNKGEVLYTFDWANIFRVAIAGGVIVEEFLLSQGIILFNQSGKNETNA